MMTVSDSRPRILVNHVCEPPNRITGVTKYAFELLKGLVASGSYSYTLVTTWDEAKLPPELRSPAVDVVTVPFLKSASASIAVQMLRMPFIAWRKRAALVFHPTPLGSYSDPWPHVVTAHDLYYETNPDEYLQRRVKFWFAVFPRILARSRAIIAVSGQTKAEIARFYPSVIDKVTVVQEAGALSASPTAEPFVPPHGGPFGILVGNLTPNKNAPAVAEALRILADRRVEATVYHIGRDENGVVARAQAAGKPVRLFPVGTVSDETLASAYATAAFFVAPSTREGFCLPVIEAQSYGAPAIVSDIPVLREVAGDGATFIDPQKPVEIADAMQAILGDDSLRARLSAAAKANAARFSWARAARETEAVFASALATKRR